MVRRLLPWVWPAAAFAAACCCLAPLLLPPEGSGAFPPPKFDYSESQVVAERPLGGDRVLLAAGAVARLSAAGEVRWSLPFGEEGTKGGLVDLPGGHLLAFLYHPIADEGVWVARLDPATGEEVWHAHCPGLGVCHSKYLHEADVALGSGGVRVTSRGSGGEFVEVRDVGSGRRLGREERVGGGWGLRRDPPPDI
jgi:hypothetical protein